MFCSAPTSSLKPSYAPQRARRPSLRLPLDDDNGKLAAILLTTIGRTLIRTLPLPPSGTPAPGYPFALVKTASLALTLPGRLPRLR